MSSFSSGHAAIWKYFLLEGNVDNQPINTDTVYCSICFQSVRSSRGSTAVMKQHIQLYHPEELGGSDLETQDDTRPASPGSRAMEDNNSPFTNIVSESRVPAPPVVSIRLQDADVQRHFLSFCAETHLPLSAQLPSKLCDLINRLTNIRCQLEDTFSTEEWRETAVNTADRTTETVIRPAIQDSQNEISLTASIWRSACGDNMLTLSVHLLNSTWSKSSYVLETIRLLDMNNADLLTNTLISTLTYWKIELRNIRAATVSLNQQVLTSFNYMGPCLAIPCLGEAWNYSLTSAFEDSRVSVIVEKANNIVQYFNVNKETREKLRNRLKDLSLPVKDLFVPNLSCWCSLLRMINSVLNGLPAVCALYHDLPTAEITESWRLVSSLLTPLLEFSKALAAEESLTISAILPLVHSITDDILVNSGDVISPEAVLNDVQINDLKVLGIDLRSKIRDSLASSFSKPEVRSHLLIATLLDPRFRTATIPGLDETHVVIKSMMPEIQVESIDQTPKRQSSGMFATMLQSITPNVRSDDSEYEFHQYLRAPGCAISEDPLAWWLKHASSYPRLATLARRYLSTPALAGDSYKLFDPQRLDRADDRPGLDTQEAYLYTFLAASSSCHNS